MSYEPLHHKYRPQSFGELVGQAAIAATLTNAIEQQRIAPAYFFTGARGTGKTSSARILAKSLNCLKSKVPTATPCGVCEVCQAIARGSALDVIEIDAASNTGVDNIRELIERAQFAPVQCRYKVYIIDEVHMLSTAAFNALLKTLEEPPDRVVFVLATTDPQRVLPTIISRCQRFDYRRIPLEAMVAHLRYIATQEQIPITADAITLVAQMAQGGLRDAESLLDQLSLLAGEISVEQVWDLVGSVPERDLLELLQAIVQDNPELLLDSTRRLMERGREPLIVLQNLASFYRDLLIAKTAPARPDLVALTLATWQQLCDLAQTFDLFTILAGQQHLRSAEVQLKHTTQPRLWLEVALMGLLPSAISQEARRPPPQPTAGKALHPAIVPGNPVEQPQPKVSQPKRADKPQAQADDTGARTPETRDPPEPLGDSPSFQDQTPPLLPPAARSAAPPTESDRALPATLDLNQIWQDVIREMVPYSSQVMVRQQCRLKSFDGQQARIAVSTQPLLKMAQTKLPNIEAAFEVVFSRKIHIALEVSPGGAIVETPPPPPPPPHPPAPSPELPNSTAPTTQPQPSDHLPPELPLVPPPQVPPSQAQKALPTAAPEAVSPPLTPPPEHGWELEDEATRAAKKLAEFFAGKVVDLGDDSPSDHTPPAAKLEIASVPDSTTSATKTDTFWNATDAVEDPLAEADGELDEDDDVPF